MFNELNIMKTNIQNMFSESRSYSDVSLDRRLTVGSPSGLYHSALLKMIAVLVMVFSLGVGQMWGADTELTFSLTSNPGGWPTANSTTLTNYTYTLNAVNYTFALKNVKCNSGYLMLTATAVLGLPAIEGKTLKKVVVSNSGGCSTSTQVGVSSSSSSASSVSGGAAQTYSTQSSSYTYNLTGLSANTVYYLYITNKNCQITQIALTYYSDGGGCSEVTDEITASDLTATGSSYTNFSNIAKTSSAKYAGNSALYNSTNIQLRSNNSNSGIVSTSSGGDRVKSVTLTVASGSNTINVYGKNTAYSAASDLYTSGSQGTLIGSTSTTATLTITGDYAYVGIRSNSGAVYLSSVDITWESCGGGGTYTFHLMLPVGDGTFTQYDVTDKSLLGSSHYSDIVCKYKECYGSAAFYNGSWTNYWCPSKTNFADRTTSQGTRYSSSTTFPISSETEITLYPQFAYGSGTSYYHTDPLCPTYHVYYDGNGKTGGTVPANSGDLDGGETITVSSNTLTKTNYTFTGWNTANDGSGTHYDGGATFTMPAADVTLYAEWCRDLSTLNLNTEFDLEAGSITGVSARIDWAVEDATKYDWALKKGASFDGGTAVSSGSNITADNQELSGLDPGTHYWFKLTAKNDCGATSKEKTIDFTTLNAYVIQYNNNGGSGSIANGAKTEGVNFTLSSGTGMSKDGYHQTGWLLNSASGTHYNLSGTYSTDAAATFYAEWTANTYSVVFNRNGGTGGANMANQNFTYDVAQNLTTCTYTKTDYNFAGWATSQVLADAGTVAYTDEQSVNNLTTTNSGTVNLYAVWTEKTYTNYRTSCGCAAWGLHFGTSGQSDWDEECFTKVIPADASDHEWQITNFIIPNKTHWYVDNAAGDDAKKLETTWSSLYFAASQGSGSRPMVGSATGAVGTVRIYDNSDWNNRYAGFIPNGYVLKFGTTEYPFTLASGNEYHSDPITYNGTSARYNVSVGIEDTNGDYVSTDNTSEMQHIFLNTGGTSLWSNLGVGDFGLYDVTNSQFTCLMVAVPGTSYIYEGWVPSNCTQVIFVRLKSTTLAWGEGNANVYNQTNDLTLQANKNYWTVTGWGGGDGNWSSFDRVGYFRIDVDYTDKNWYARFIPNIVLSYDKNDAGASGTTAITTVAADAANKNVTVAACGFTAPSGYHFDHWDTAPDGSGTDYAPGATYNLTTDATLYAIWAPNTHTLTWNLDGGAISSAGTAAGTVAYGTSLTAPTVTKTGYTFNVWSPSVPATMPDADATYTATWTPITYSVRFNANGGSGSMSNQNFTYGVAQNLTNNAFTHATKAFGGWTTNSDGTGDEYANGASVSNLSSTQGAIVDLYAKWVDCTLYTVTLKVHNDTYQVLQQGSCGAAVDLTGITPLATCLGDYTFVGWRTTDPGTTTAPSITTSYTPASNATLYAVYSKTEYVDWERIEDDDDLSIYDTYIITSYDNPNAMLAEQGSNNRHDEDITKSADKKTIASVPNTVGQFMLEADGSNWNIFDMLTAGTEKYLYAAGGSSNNYLRLTADNTDGNAEWSISISDGAADVKAQGDAMRNWMLFNTSSNVFTCYNSKASGYKYLSFYKYVHTPSTTYTTQPEISVRVVTKGTEDPALGTYTIVPGVVCEGGSVALTATPTGSNSFVNWTSDNGGTFANASSASTTFTPANATTTVTANFGMLITLDKNNVSASTDGSASVTANATSLGALVAPTYTGHHVEGYYDDDVYTHKVATDAGVLQENVAGYTGAGGAWTKGSGATLYTRWEANTHTLTWNLDGGATSSTTHTGYASSTVAYGTSITYPANNTMSRTGYTFNGWSPASPQTMPDEDMTITALWTQNNWTLTMATDPVGVSSAITAPRTGAGTVTNKHYGDVITVTVSTPSHYTFTGWTRSDGGGFTNASLTTTTFTMPDANVTVTANFEAETPHTVTWSDNGETSTEQVYTGETTTFPALANNCDLYVAAGWVQDNSNTFTAETATKPGTIYAAGETTPAVSGNVTYKAVYRHKIYTDADFENGTTDGKAYYLYANYSGNNHYKTVRYYSGSTYGFSTTTSKASAIPVYLIKTGDYYYMRDVSTDKYYYSSTSSSNYNISEADDFEDSDAYKWSFAASACETSGLGDYNITNKAHAANTTLRLNSSGDYIKEYKQTGACPNKDYYNLNLEKAYYYRYTPTAACYDITITVNAGGRGTLETVDGSNKLVGNELTVTPNCGYAISSVSVASGTATYTPSSLDYPTTATVTYTIIPTSNCTFRVNFTTENSDYKHTISFLDGATVIGQTKTDPMHECGSYSLPNGYSTAAGDGGACDDDEDGTPDWTFDGWTATNYVYGQMAEPSGIQAAESSQTATGDATWYAVYHKSFAAGDFFNIKFSDKYIADYGSNQFTTTTTAADALQFNMEDGYLYYIDKVTRAKKWVYYTGPSGQNVTVSDAKPSSNYYKTTFTESGGVYDIVSNSKYLALSGDKVKYLTTASNATKPNAEAFNAYYPKTECTTQLATITFDAGAGNTFSSNSSQTYAVEAEINGHITLPIGGDIVYDDTDWTFAGWSASTINSIAPGAPSDLIPGGGSYTVTEDATLHAVYNQTPPIYDFNNHGGTYLIWATVGDVNYYVKSTGAQTQGKLGYTVNCSEASIFEFVETETEGKYKLHIVGEAKYLGGEGCADANTDFVYTNANAAPIWTVTQRDPDTYGKWRVVTSCGNRGFVCQHSGSAVFGHYSTTQIGAGYYFDVNIGHCDDYYTTNPNKDLSVSGDLKVTSSNGRMVMAKDPLVINASNLAANSPITITSNSSDVYFSEARDVNIEKASKPTTSLTFNATTGELSDKSIYVHYMPSVSTHGIEDVIVTVASPEKTTSITIKVRHMPATFAICAKVGTAWYALNGNMRGAATPKAIQIDVDESTWIAYAPDTCAYQLWPVKTTSGSGDRYQANGEKVRFSAVNNVAQRANAGLWANNSSGNNNIDNDAAITAITNGGDAAYEWKIAATEVSGTWKYTLQTDQSTNKNKLNVHRDANLVWGTYTEGQAVTSDIYLLPMTEITPLEFEVIEWYPTKVLIQTNNTISSPTVNIGGVTDADASCTSKGAKWYEIGNLSLTDHPTELMSIRYTSGEPAVTYSGVKTIPIIISRETKSVNNGSGLNEPFATLGTDSYNWADLVVRDGAVLTVNGTSDQNKFFDVIIYPNSKISVPAKNVNDATCKLNVHSLTFFGGIDEIYNGSSYDLDKYGVPELSLKGQFGLKTVTTINYDMRVDLSQMYSLTVPYDVALANITYWDGTAMTPGSNLYVSAYDGDARAKKDLAHAWVYETAFASKFGAATLKAGVGYTISAELQSGVGNTYSIIRMPMTSNVAANNTEAAKTVAVTAHGKGADVSDNHKGWNLVGNPYMVSISGTPEEGEEGQADLVVGKLVESGTGPWDWDGETYPYRYVTIPNDNGTDYSQAKFTDVTLKPFKNFFIQVDNSGDLGFTLATRQNAPARYLQAQEREVEFEILLDNESRSDNTGLLIAEKYSPAYEINADLEKMIGTMSVYTIFGGYNLAYNALSPEDASQPIPVGFVANVAGDYTFSLSDKSDVEGIEHIWLTDYEVAGGFTTDLMDDTYSFGVKQAGRNETRFTLRIEMKDEAEVPTDIGNVEGMDSEHPLKFLYRDKLYILRNGVLYDATGKKVK